MKKIQDLRSLIAVLEQKNLIEKIDAVVDPYLEITEIVDQLYNRYAKDNKTPNVLLFNHVRNSEYPIITNLMGNKKILELLIGCSIEKFSSELQDILNFCKKFHLYNWIQRIQFMYRHRKFLYRFKFLKTNHVKRSKVKSEKDYSEQVNLFKFPITHSWPLDSGPFITSGLVITKSPLTGERNLGLYRIQVIDKNHVFIHWQIQKGGGLHYHEAVSQNLPLEVAIVIGTDPILWLGGILPLPENVDEISFCGFLSNHSIKMIDCETIDLSVPAHSEIILEGKVYPNKKGLEGPFGDHFGHYSSVSEFPIMDVQCVTHKPDLIYQTAVVGKPPKEDLAVGESITQLFLPILKLTRPELEDLWAYYEAGFHNLLAIRVKQRYGKEAIKTAFSILGEGQLSLSKCIILVNQDIDIKNIESVLKNIQSYLNTISDIIIIPKTSQDTLDFTGPKINYGSKMILDATKKENIRPQKSLCFDEKFFSNIILKIHKSIIKIRVIVHTLLIIQLKLHSSQESLQILHQILQLSQIKYLKLIALVSEDVDMTNMTSIIWGIFTRFDCQKDVILPERRTMPIGINATWKKHYPYPIEMDSQVIQSVKENFKKNIYGFKK